MLERGLLLDFSPAAVAELEHIRADVASKREQVEGSRRMRDLWELLWAFIDNDDSLDIDQLSVAEKLKDGRVKILVAIADVDALVKDGTAIDEHARHNTISVYTAARIFPMLPEQLSTGLTSLNLDKDRLALVIEMVMTSAMSACGAMTLTLNQSVSAGLPVRGSIRRWRGTSPYIHFRFAIEDVASAPGGTFRLVSAQSAFRGFSSSINHDPLPSGSPTMNISPPAVAWDYPSSSGSRRRTGE